MNKFSVGAEVVRHTGGHLNMHEGETGYVAGFHPYQATHVSIEGFLGWHKISNLRPVKTDLITVSSLDYMTNKELTKEDKLIIKEALDATV